MFQELSIKNHSSLGLSIVIDDILNHFSIAFGTLWMVFFYYVGSIVNVFHPIKSLLFDKYTTVDFNTTRRATSLILKPFQENRYIIYKVKTLAKSVYIILKRVMLFFHLKDLIGLPTK